MLADSNQRKRRKLRKLVGIEGNFMKFVEKPTKFAENLRSSRKIVKKLKGNRRKT
jgi:hypothetical protein